jgi:hypothetical protein
VEPEAQQLYEEMKLHLGKVVPDVEIYYKAEIAVEIQRPGGNATPSSSAITTWSRRCSILSPTSGDLLDLEP